MFARNAGRAMINSKFDVRLEMHSVTPNYRLNCFLSEPLYSVKQRMLPKWPSHVANVKSLEATSKISSDQIYMTKSLVLVLGLASPHQDLIGHMPITACGKFSTMLLALALRVLSYPYDVHDSQRHQSCCLRRFTT